ncbi:MAG: GNAT family N-acetyltransferase [Planctomycetota bacterium]
MERIETVSNVRRARLGPRDRSRVIALLEREAVTRVYLLGLVNQGLLRRPSAEEASGLPPGAAPRMAVNLTECRSSGSSSGSTSCSGSGSVSGFWGAWRGRELADVCLVSWRGGVMPTAEDPEAGKLWGAFLCESRAPRLRLVTDRVAGDRVVRSFEREGGEIVLEREQLFYRLGADTPVSYREPKLRRARLCEAAIVARLSLDMDREDVPLPGAAKTDVGADQLLVTEARIRGGRVFVLVEDGEIAFKVDVCVRGRSGAQVEGVYTVPSHRGRGLATRCVAELSRRLLRDSPFVTLHVAATNAAALTAYERAGFCYHARHLLAVLRPPLVRCGAVPEGVASASKGPATLPEPVPSAFRRVARGPSTKKSGGAGEVSQDVD